MILPPTFALPFLLTYEALLETTTKMLNPEAFENAVSREEKRRNLCIAREHLFSGEVLFDEVVSRTREEGEPLNDEALESIRRLRYQVWIYLRDTSRGSILLDTDTSTSFLVHGLTESLRMLVGQSSVVIWAAVAPLRDVYFFDWFISTSIYIDSNMRRELNERQQSLREQGTYFKRYNENVPHFPILR